MVPSGLDRRAGIPNLLARKIIHTLRAGKFTSKPGERPDDLVLASMIAGFSAEPAAGGYDGIVVGYL